MNPDGSKYRVEHDIEHYGRIGMIGPHSTAVAGIQRIDMEPEVLKQAMQVQFGHDEWTSTVQYQDAYDSSAAIWKTGKTNDVVVSTAFLSGFCMMIRRDCLLDVWLEGDNGPMFDADQYPIAGYEDNDLCVRVTQAGWRMGVANSTYIGHLGHQTFDRAFPEMMRGMRNRANYYRKWRNFTTRPQKLVGFYRVAIPTVADLHYWKRSIARACEIVDGLAVLLTKNPLEMVETEDFQQMQNTLSENDRKWLQRCAGKDAKGVAEATQEWVDQIRTQVPKGRCGELVVDVWDGEWNERDERNRAMEMAHTLNGDWAISIDHDEVFEDRLDRAYFDRLFQHPDPMVDGFECGWVNHWENPGMIRVDRPWGDGGTYNGGMAGTRLYRVVKSNPKKILAGTEVGLHCGNVPDSGNGSRRIAGFRFRHFGYMMSNQRGRKFAWYSNIDPNPDAILVGGTNYNHIVDDEGMTLRPWVPQNGIGFYMLTHEGENPEDIGRWLNDIYALVDGICLVWTGEWEESDKSWLSPDVDPLTIPESEWPKTGPGRDLATFAHVFGAKWVHHVFNDDLSSCRNAALEHLHQEGHDWAWFHDADEQFDGVPVLAYRAIRTMAETSDGWGWMFRFRNFIRNAPPSMSECLRMTRLDKSGIMRMTSRVHEGFEKATKTLQSNGIHPKYRYAPFLCNHYGLSLDDDKIKDKLIKYRRLLLKELGDNPHNSNAWVSLGLQFINDGNVEKAKECYERGVACAGESYLAFKELGLHHLRIARALLAESGQRVHERHPWSHTVNEVMHATRDLGSQSRVGTAQLPDVELPDFHLPEDVLQSMIDDGLVENPE